PQAVYLVGAVESGRPVAERSRIPRHRSPRRIRPVGARRASRTHRHVVGVLVERPRQHDSYLATSARNYNLHRMDAKPERLFIGVPGTAPDGRCIVMALPGNLPGKPVPPENWHFPLRFLGSTAATTRDRIVGLLR